MSTAAQSPADRSAALAVGSVVISGRTAVVAGAILLLAFVAVFWSFFYKQAVMAFERPADWGHVLVIPAIAGYFVWLQRHKLTAKPFKPSLWGEVFVALGLTIFSASVVWGPLRNDNISGMGVGIALVGVLVSVFGWRAMKYLWFPCVYWMVFGQYISDRALSIVTERMQDWSAVGADVVLNIITIDTDRKGNVLTVSRSDGTQCPLNVAEACSGMRMLVAFMALGVAMAYTGLPLWWQRVALVLIGIPISLFVNILRVSSLGVLATWDSNFTAGQAHEMIGLLWLLPAFLLFLGALWIIRNLVTDEPAATGKAAAPAPKRAAP